MSTSSGTRDYGRFDELAEEFAERYRRGERPSLQEYVDRLPEMADEIRECSRPWSRSNRSKGTPATRCRLAVQDRAGPVPNPDATESVGTHPGRTPPGDPNLGIRNAPRVPGAGHGRRCRDG